jgi:F0F1-type ATP synthase alpha subunit
MGVVVAHRPPLAFVYAEMDAVHEIEGTVQVLDSLACVPVDQTKKVVDCFGRSFLDDEATGPVYRPIFAPIPKVSDIALINTPLLTGVTMFDALAPIGKGQNMLLIGHDILDMRRYVCTMLSAQVSEGTNCIYASTADNEQVVHMLAEAGLSDDITLVLGKKSSQHDDAPSMAAEATVAAATACSIAETLALEKGVDTLVIVDTLDYHKCLWDATTRVLVDVFGVEAVVKSDRDGGASSEMRAFFSSLVQRSAKYNEKNGGGSVTLVLLCTIPKMVATNDDTVFTPEDFASSPAKVKDRIDFLVRRNLPLTGATLRKIQIPIPSDAEGAKRLALQHVDDLISMSDGQIWLDEDLESKGRRPAMDFQRSVTRIGIGADTESRADARAMRRVVEGLRLDLSQALDLGGAEIGTEASKNQARNALGWLLAMHQPSTSGARTLSESCTALLAASRGYLGESLDGGALAGTDAGNELMAGLLKHVKSIAAEALEAVDSTQDMTEESLEAIDAAIKSYFLL